MINIDTSRLDNVRPAKQIYAEITDLDPLSKGASTIPREVEVQLRDQDGPKQIAMWRGLPAISVGSGVRCWRATGDTQILEIAGGGGSSSSGNTTAGNFTATTAPTVNDDSGDGYSVGSLWVDTTNNDAYIAVNVSVGGAVWRKINGLGTEEWTTWTPTVSQPGSVTVTVISARYKLVDDVCHMEVELSVTGSGTAGNNITIGGQPAAAQPKTTGGYHAIGSFVVLDSGAIIYTGTVAASGPTTFWLYTDASTGALGTNPSFALASGDVISFVATYEVANVTISVSESVSVAEAVTVSVV